MSISNKLLHGTRDYDISVGIPEAHDSRYTQSMLVILSGSRDLHWVIGMLVCVHTNLTHPGVVDSVRGN